MQNVASRRCRSCLGGKIRTGCGTKLIKICNGTFKNLNQDAPIQVFDMQRYIQKPEWAHPDLIANYEMDKVADIMFHQRNRTGEHFRRFCHFRIRDNVIDHCDHFNDDKQTHEVYRSVLHGLYMLKEFVRLPDVDFILSISELEQFSLGLPVFAYAKMEDAQGVIRMPMWEYMTFWAVANLAKVDQALQIDWRTKQSKVFWRGSASGRFTCTADVNDQISHCENLDGWQTGDWDRYPRARIVQLSKFWNDGVDARFTDAVYPELEGVLEKRG